MNLRVFLSFGTIVFLTSAYGWAADPMDVVQTRSYRFVNLSAEDAKPEIDRILADLGSREGSRMSDAKTLTISDRVSRIRQIEDIIATIDLPLTQTTPIRKRMEIRMRLSQHYASMKKERDAALLSGRINTPSSTIAAPVAVPTLEGVPGAGAGSAVTPEQFFGREPEDWSAALNIVFGLRLKGIIEDEHGMKTALLYQDANPYTLKQGTLYDLGRYKVKGISGEIGKEQVVLQVPNRRPVVLKLYEQTY